MEPLNYIRGVKEPKPGTKASNLSPALRHPHVNTSRNITNQAIGRRVDTNAHRFLLRLGEWGKSSATYEETSDDHYIFIFTFTGGGL